MPWKRITDDLSPPCFLGKMALQMLLSVGYELKKIGKRTILLIKFERKKMALKLFAFQEENFMGTFVHKLKHSQLTVGKE